MTEQTWDSEENYKDRIQSQIKDIKYSHDLNQMLKHMMIKAVNEVIKNGKYFR